MNRNKYLEEAEIVISTKQKSIEQLIQIVAGFGLKVCVDAATGEVFTKRHSIGSGFYAADGGLNPDGFNTVTTPPWSRAIRPPQFGGNPAAARLVTQNIGELQRQFTEMAIQQQEQYSSRPPTYPFSDGRDTGDQRCPAAFVKFKEEFNKEFKEEFNKDPILGRKYLEETYLIGPPKFRRSMMFLFDLLMEQSEDLIIAPIITDCFFYGAGNIIDVKNWEPDSLTSKTEIDFTTISSFLHVYPLGEKHLRNSYSTLTARDDNYTKVFFSVAYLLTKFYYGELGDEICGQHIKNIFVNAFDKYLETVKL